MKKLNERKLRWILRELKRGELSIYRIARQQGVTPRWVRKLRNRFRDRSFSEIQIGVCGRPPKPIPKAEKQLILELYERMPMGAVKLERYLELNDMKHIPHNRIHRILMDAGKAKPTEKKIRRKKWVHFERRRGNSLWHGDYCEIEHKQVLALIDDASRYIVGYGVFDSATTDNALIVLNDAIANHGMPKQLMTDHGTQFCANEERTYKFSEKLRKQGIVHIMSRVKRPQSNGKIERRFGTIKRLYAHFGRDMLKAVECYNRMLHLSLDMSPAEAYQIKMR